MPWAIDASPEAPKSGPDAAQITKIYALGFGEDDWDPPLRASDAVVEFATNLQPAFFTTLDGSTTWTDSNNVLTTLGQFATAVKTPARTLAELNMLEVLMLEDREHYLEEALAQADAAPQYYTALLGIAAGKKPWTKALMSYLVRVGEFVALHYKVHYNRPRPSTFDPGLTPPYGPPGHAAFPSGHSLQMHLMSFVLLQIAGIALRVGPKPATWASLRLNEPIPLGTDSALFWLAIRIAKNRERLGFHFESDSVAGRQIAVSLSQALMAGWDTVRQAYAAVAAAAGSPTATLADKKKLTDADEAFARNQMLDDPGPPAVPGFITLLGLTGTAGAHWVCFYRLLENAASEWPPATAGGSKVDPTA